MKRRNGTRNPWSVTRQKLKLAVQRIVAAAGPCRVVLFGSSVHSISTAADADFLIVTKRKIANTRHESARIRRTLRGIPMAMDLIVIDEERFERLKDVHGYVYSEAIRTGKVLHEAA